ncbi:hypothetical protein [Streptomyces acidiscabies]|uniref:Uncharacterized protein n=1 Tax=Streptomyces acidiscabies TaxID=42234 RepID=A0ABU4LW04_9ACTN|nr:hypothetical protein [Streptomyces acidiscabies]MDX3019925.1 hypothetical protein [Streptomyces acidiscabies]
MTPEPQQVGSPKCGCHDCYIDYPPETYGERPPNSACVGPWRARYRSNGKHRSKTLPSRAEAMTFLAAIRRGRNAS